MAIVAATLLFSVLSGQQFSDISHHFTAGFEVASRYVDAMTNWETEPFDIAFVLIVALLIPLLPFFLWRKTPGHKFIRSGLISGIFCILLFLVFKFTFVGFHGHKLPVYWGSPFLIALFPMLATGGRNQILHKRSVVGMALPRCAVGDRHCECLRAFLRNIPLGGRIDRSGQPGSSSRHEGSAER